MAPAVDPRWAWDAYQPSPRSPWDLKKVGHLYRRAGFGATWSELDTALKAGPQETVTRLIEGKPGEEAFAAETEPLAKSTAKGNNGKQAGAWWLYRMMYTPHPLREKMTLFWHNHFATSFAKVRNAGYMLGQYELMHRYALGNFRSMLVDMSKDPAMMVWLDTNASKKVMPNENYARELMELFSLGIGNYTEKDIREAARAFTGWKIEDGKAVFDPKQHDDGEKTVLGQTGKWQGSDIVRICLEQKSAPYFICTKLYKFLVSEAEPPTHEILEPLAEQFRDSNYDFGALVARILRSNLFYSPDAYRTCVKSPVEFTLGLVRGLEGHIGSLALALSLESLGQDLFHPPSVKGWDGGPAWLNGQTLLFRQNLALAITSTSDPRFGRRTDPVTLVRKYGKGSDADVVDFFLRLFLDGEIPAETRQQFVDYQQQVRNQTVPVYWTEQDAADHRIRALCHLVLTLPEFQLN